MRILFFLLMVLLLTVAAVIGCGGEGEIQDGVPFTIQVDPKDTEVFPLGEFSFSVTASSEEARKAINISASISSASLSIEPEAIMPGEVAKIIVVPFAGISGQTLTLNIEGERDGIVEKVTATMFVATES